MWCNYGQIPGLENKQTKRIRFCYGIINFYEFESKTDNGYYFS